MYGETNDTTQFILENELEHTKKSTTQFGMKDNQLRENAGEDCIQLEDDLDSEGELSTSCSSSSGTGNVYFYILLI